MISRFHILKYARAVLLMLLCIQTAAAADYQMQTLNDAHARFKAATNQVMYAEAAEHYEFLTQEEGIRNGELFYNAGNSWFMAGDPGRAILNYRRAEKLIPTNKDLQYNLKAALALKSDLIPAKEPHPMAARFLGWHLNTSTTFRWRLFACCWILFWSAGFWMSRTPKKEARITAGITGILSVLLLGSLITETVMSRKQLPGVITAREVLARKGDGPMYAPAFLEPLHSGTEFKQHESRGGWRHIELADGQTCWIPVDAAETVDL